MNINFNEIYQNVWNELKFDWIENKNKKILAITSAIIFFLLIIGIVLLIIIPFVHFQNSKVIFASIGSGLILLGLFLGLPISLILNSWTKKQILNFYKNNESSIIKNTINKIRDLEIFETQDKNFILKISNQNNSKELKISHNKIYLKKGNKYFDLNFKTNLFNYEINWKQSKIIKSRLNYCFAAKEFLAKKVSKNIQDNLQKIFNEIKNK